MKDALINLSICLSDIDKAQIKKSEKNGKLYLSVTIVGRKEADQFGNNVTAFISQTKEQRAAKQEKIYIGNGQYIEFSKEDVGSMPTASKDETGDLPF